MKKLTINTLKSLGLITLMLLNYNILNATNGESCEEPLTFDIGEEQEFQFLSQQSEIYFEFQATDDSMLVHILNLNNTPYADISGISVYSIEDCDHLELFAKKYDTASYKAGYLPLLGLAVGNNYLIKVERDVNGSLPLAYFDLLVAAHYSYPCPNPMPQPCNDLIINGDFTYATKQNPDRINAINNNEVCGKWESYFNNSGDVTYVYRGDNQFNVGPLNNNPFVDLLSSRFNTNPIIHYMGVLGNEVDIQSGKDYTLSFNLRRSSVTSNNAPDYFKAWFIKSSELTNFPPNSYLAAHLLTLTTNRQEIASIIPSQTNASWKNFDACITADDDYDRIIFFAYHTTNFTASRMQIDNISLITLDAGEDVSGVSCQPKMIGPACVVPGATYQWSPTTGLDNPNSPNPITSASTNTTYTLTMNLPNGCSVTDQVFAKAQFQYVIPHNKNVGWVKINLPTTTGLKTENSSNNVDQIIDKEIFIEGTFIVEQDFNFRDCKIYMGENAKILVYGAEFSITGDNVNYQRFIKSCDPDKFWDGIHVNASFNNNSSLYIGSYSSINQSGEKLKFSNSKNGIILTSNPLTHISDVHFDRNERVMDVNANNNVSNVVRLEQSIIECSTPLIDPNFLQYYPSNSIRITNNFAIIPNDPLIEITGVQFFGTGGNLIIDNSSVGLDDNTYQGFYNDINFPGILKNEFAVKIFGKNVGAGTAVQKITSIDERFINNSKCLEISKDIQFEISNFTVNIDNLSNQYYNTVPNGSFMKISNNLENINVYDNGSNSTLIYNVSSAFNIYNAPYVTIDNIYMDLEFQGVGVNSYNNKTRKNSAAIYIDNYNLQQSFLTPIKISNNTIKHAKNGIISNFAQVEIIDNTIEDMNDLTAAPSSCLPFSPPCPKSPAWGIKVNNGEATIIQNKIKNNINQYGVQPSTNTDITGIEVINSMLYTAGNTTYSDGINCNNVENTGVGIKFSAENYMFSKIYDNKMANHTYGFVLANNGYLDNVGDINNAAHNAWDGSYSASETYSDQSDASLCTIFTEGGGGIYDPQILPAHASLGFNRFSKNSSASPVVNSGCMTRSKVGKPKNNATPNYNKSGGSSLSTITPSFGKKPYMVQAADSALMYHNQMNFYRLAKDSALMASALWKPFVDSMKLTPMGRTLNISNRHAITTNTSNFDANLIIMNPIFERFEQGLKLSATELDKTRLMARACPYYDGIAVYQARYILSNFGENNIVNPCELVEKPQKISIKNGNKSGINNDPLSYNEYFKIFPNPTKNVLNIDFKVNENEVVQLEIIDVMGKVQLRVRLNASTFHRIQLNDMNSAIYFYRLIKNDATIHSGKLIIE